MKKIRFFWFCCLLVLAGSQPLCAQNDAENDAFLQLLRQELQQQFDSLLKTTCPPYYMAYRVNETTEHLMTANFGQIYADNTLKTATLTIEIRVGNPETDNFHYLNRQNRLLRQVSLPIEENESLLRKIIRKETVKTLQAAVVQSVDNQVKTAILNSEDNLEKYLFMSSDKDGYYDPPMMDSRWNAEEWHWRLGYCTRENMLWLTTKSAELRYVTTRKYLVNSDKNYFVENHSSALLKLQIEGMTQENIPEHIERQFFAFHPDQLPDAYALNDEMTDMEVTLSNVFFAENPGSLQCPVLFSPNAASVLLHSLLGHELENTENSLLRGRIGQKVLPESFTVYSDPTVSNAAGHYYGGHYIFDDEGVKGERVVHVTHGEFQKMLASRTQQPNAYQSNGHARGKGQLPTVRQSNLFIESSKALNNNQLFDLLMEEVANKRLDYGIYVDEVEILCDTNDVITVYPTVCYKRSTNPREPEETLRDVILKGGKQQWLNNLVAAGDVKGSVAVTCQSQQEDLLTSCSSPALLFRSVEVRELLKTPQPDIKRLLTGGGTNDISTQEAFLLSAQHEWETDVEHLKLEDENAPYYEDFLMTDGRIYTVEASEGSLLYSNEKPVRQFVPKVLLGNDAFNNENLYEETAQLATLYPLPIFETKTSFARDFKEAAKTEYQKALSQLKIKQTLVEQKATKLLPDRSAMKSTQTYDGRAISYPSLTNLEHFARETSSQLAQNDFLSRSGAHVYVWMGNVCYWSSEKTTFSKQISIIAVQMFGAVETADNEEFADTMTVFLPCMDSLFSVQYIHNEIDKLVLHLRLVKQKGQKIEEFYVGPLLVEGDAVGQMLASAFMENRPNLLAYRAPLLTSDEGRKNVNAFEEQLDQVVTSKQISVTANKSGDQFEKSTFCRQDKIDAEGAEVSEMEIVRNGELITLMGNRTVTKSTPYTNGFQQLAIHKEGCITTRGASRIDVESKTSVPRQKLKQMLIKEAKKQGCRYAYIIRQIDNGSLTPGSKGKIIQQLYRVDVRNGKETPVTKGVVMDVNFGMLHGLIATSSSRTAYPVMVRVNGAMGSRDFPFAGVPTCIIAPDGFLLRSGVIGW